MNSLKVCYVIYGEEIWSPLLKRQVIELLETALKKDKELKIKLLYIYPWYWRFTKRKSFRAFFQESALDRIEFKPIRLPYPFPLPYFLPQYIKGRGFRPYEPHSGRSFWIVQGLVFVYLLKYSLLDKYPVFHCRSYRSAALLLPLIKLIPGVKLIFDPRSDYPEEHLIQSAWTTTSYSYKFWKRQEYNLLKHASATICITERYHSHYQRIYPAFPYKTIPNNVDFKQFSFSAQARKQLRSQYNLKDKLVFCYLGTMGVHTWHSPEVYATLIKSFRSINSPHLFLFLVPEGVKQEIERVFDTLNIDRNEYLILSPPYDQVAQFLSMADFGLLYLKAPKIALGTKVVEYNAVGLPVLVNNNIMSAADYVQTYKIGEVINIGLGGLDVKRTKVEAINFQELIKKYPREVISRNTESLFSNETVACEYLNLYRSLSDNALLKKS